MHKIRTKFHPEDEIEVEDAEYLDLKRRDLLYEGEARTDEGARRAVERQQRAEVSGAAPRRRPARKRTAASAAATETTGTTAPVDTGTVTTPSTTDAPPAQNKEN